MKKFTLVFSMFFLAMAGKSFAQISRTPVAQESKTTVGATPKQGETGYTSVKMEKAFITSAKPNEASKPAPAKPVAKPIPGTKATSDYLIKIEDVRGESESKP